ncbi:MAG TPA: Ig-like domain-containing protein [Gemmatimonadales bacterium]|nr:Ig-like domain-containing protein [Gemmatimonadales bacterium]
MLTFPRLPILRLLLLTAAVSCGGDGTTDPVIRTPSSLTLVGGGNQEVAAGSPLPSPVTFRVSDQRGPLAGVAVRLTVEQGAGSVTPTVATTGPDGVVTATWSVGTTAGGLNVLRASIDGTSLAASASASVIPGTATYVTPAAGSSQFAPVGQPVPEPPAVRVTDPFGNPVPGATVTFAVSQGGGSLGATQSVSDAQGIAKAGQWVLGPAGGVNAIRATLASGGFVEIQAIGTAYAIRIVSGDNQSANSGTLIADPLVIRVVDAKEQPLADISVGFSVTAGGGQLTGFNANSGADGLVSISGWTLGTTPGSNRVRASSIGVDPVEFLATGINAVAATIEQSPAPPATAFSGNFITGPFRIRLLDAEGTQIVARPVVWAIGSGNGEVFGPSTVTDAQGYAEMPAWRLGPGTGPQVLQAIVDGLPPAEFTVTALSPPVGEYSIVIRYLGETPSAEYQAAVQAAAQVWESAIVGDLPAVAVNLGPIGLCGAVDEVVDDIIMFVRIEPIDGEFGVLGSAGPCASRQSNSLPVLGGMRLDAADVARLAAQDQLVAVVVHEMAHILGFGTRWNALNLLVGAGSADPHFTGPAARTVFETLLLSGLGYTGPKVPVENVGGPGSVGSHWRESVLRNELLTSLLNSGPNLLTALSLAGFRDMGYVMDDAVGAPIEFPAGLFGAPSGAQAREGFRFADVHRGPGVVLDAAGRIVAWVGVP